MKVIKILFIFTILLNATFKLDVSNEIDTSFVKRIVKRGWNESNSTFNHLILENVRKVIPAIMDRIKKPFNDNSSASLSSDDRALIFAYLKYLEYIGDTKKSLQIYQKILEGLNAMENNSMINIIYHETVEKEVVHALYQARMKKLYTPIEVKKSIGPLLLKESSILLPVFKNEIDSIIKILSKNIEQNLTKQKQKNLKEITIRLRPILQEFYEKCYAVNTNKEYRRFRNEYESGQKSFLKRNKKRIGVFQLLTWDYIGSVFAGNWKGGIKDDKILINSLVRESNLTQNDVNITLGSRWLLYSGTSAKYCGQHRLGVLNRIRANEDFLKNLSN